MQRIPCDERADWVVKAEEIGFVFHTIDGERYWDERAYYAFTLKEIEQDLEAPTNELAAMCRELVARAIADERIMRRLAIPERFWNYIAASWKKNDPSLYGRFDLRYDGQGPAKLLEFNADTPTSLFETGVFQWQWLEDAIARAIVPKDADQFNSVHEKLIAGWKEIGAGRALHLAGVIDDPEDGGTVAYLNDTAQQAGLVTTVLPMEQIGRDRQGQFVDQNETAIEDVQALSVGVDDARGVRRLAPGREHAIYRAALEGDPFQQSHPAVAVVDLSTPPEPATGRVRG